MKDHLYKLYKKTPHLSKYLDKEDKIIYYKDFYDNYDSCINELYNLIRLYISNSYDFDYEIIDSNDQITVNIKKNSEIFFPIIIKGKSDTHLKANFITNLYNYTHPSFSQTNIPTLERELTLNKILGNV